MNRTRNNSTLYGQLVRLAAPVALSMLSYSIMSLVDTLFVAGLGSAELAGVGIGGLLAFTLGCFAVGLFRGIKVLVAQASGAGNVELGYRYLGASLWLAGLLSVVTLACGLLVLQWVSALTASAASGAAAASYLEVRVVGLPLMVFFAALREWRYGLGDTRSPTVATVVANALNVVLDYLFIVHFEFGVSGAAWATILAQLTQLAVLSVTLERKRLSLIASGRTLVASAWKIGWPNGVQFLVNVGSFTLTTVMIAGISEVDMAGHQVAIQLLHFSFLPMVAVGEAGSILVGKAVGRNDDRAVPLIARASLYLVSAYTVVTTAVLLLFAQGFAGWFTDEPRLLASISTLLYLAASFQVADGVAMVTSGVLRGTGDVRFPALVGVLAAWLCTPTLCYYFGVRGGLGALGAWIGIAAEITVVAVLVSIRLWTGGWKASARRSRQQLESDGAPVSV